MASFLGFLHLERRGFRDSGFRDLGFREFRVEVLGIRVSGLVHKDELNPNNKALEFRFD